LFLRKIYEEIGYVSVQRVRVFAFLKISFHSGGINARGTRRW